MLGIDTHNCLLNVILEIKGRSSTLKADGVFFSVESGPMNLKEDKLHINRQKSILDGHSSPEVVYVSPDLLNSYLQDCRVSEIN